MVGRKVRIVGLKNRKDLNDKIGTIKQLFTKTGRHKIELEDGSFIAAKPANLIPVDVGV